MNANELADELNRKCTGRLVGFAATMLRQQQAEIEVLKEMLACEGVEAGREYLDYQIKTILQKVSEK